jgi:predicted dehydrogenase
MDYTKQPLTFKARKALRYVRLYGPGRTLVKVRSQYHMARSYEQLPPEPRVPTPGKHVGLLGCGKFAFAQIAYYLSKDYGQVLRGAMDVEIARAASLFQRYDLDYYTDDAARVIEDPAVDIVFIASNHASHAEYAIAALEQGKHVHIEKPHVVSDDQLRRLCSAMRTTSGSVALGFNRPLSRIGREIHARLGSQEGAAMLSWFIAGHELDADHWYHREEEGGRILGNLCHWTDFVLRLVPSGRRYPILVTPTRTEQADCDIAVTYTFADGTIAAITFSAKGHTFEGVKERFAAHRGDVLLTMDDFRTLTVDIGPERHRIVQPFRDHGHRAALHNSYALTGRDGRSGEAASVDYVWETGDLFLRTREALERRETVTVEPYRADLACVI